MTYGHLGGGAGSAGGAAGAEGDLGGNRGQLIHLLLAVDQLDPGRPWALSRRRWPIGWPAGPTRPLFGVRAGG